MKEQKKKLLEVGDTLIPINYNYGNTYYCKPVKIARLTKTIAILEGGQMKFQNKEPKSSWYAIGANGWSKTEYVLLTNELKEKYNNQQRKRKALNIIGDIKFTELDIDKLEAIVKIIESEKTIKQ